MQTSFLVDIIRGIASVYGLRRRGPEETPEQRIGRLTKALSESVSMINEIQEEIEARQALAARLKTEIQEAQAVKSMTQQQVEAVKSMTQQQVEAVAQVFEGQVRNEGRRSLISGIIVSAVFFGLGVLVTALVGR